MARRRVDGELGYGAAASRVRGSIQEEKVGERWMRAEM
jgi:hypothetical protein